jgi:hypothetical protein
MASVNAAEAVAGLALVYFLPGFGLARATFPEWRFRGPEGTVRLIETLALSLFGSVAVTVVVGFGLLNAPVGFQATWSDPVLFEALAGVSAIALVAALLRGAFARVPPSAPAPRDGAEGRGTSPPAPAPGVADRGPGTDPTPRGPRPRRRPGSRGRRREGGRAECPLGTGGTRWSSSCAGSSVSRRERPPSR